MLSVDSHHGHDAARESKKIIKIKFESTTLSTRVLQDAELGF
jgi:hypothetical protein